MAGRPRVPSFRVSTLLLVSLSLSIGWGIRGNYGHEFGAMLAGTLAGIAVCLFSGREDWRRRVAFFAFFGALGWGFGGSIAYMPTISYTQSGQLPTQLYGFLVTFITGFLWAGMGGAGTAYPAVENRERLTAFFRPLCWIFAFWTVQYFFEDAFVTWYDHLMRGAEAASSDFRQKNPFYWLDSEWLEASMALIALCAFDLWDRRFGKIHWMALLGLAGAAAGFVAQQLLALTGLLGLLLKLFVHHQGDLSMINPATGQPFDPANLITNWPQVFFDLGPHMGWILGLIAGLGVYFYRHGQWRSGASLLMHMTLGSYLVFLIGPVFLSNFFGWMGGFRMMPPRGDSWANIVGVFAGMLIYVYRNGLGAVGFASIVSGTIGGLGFMTAQMLKMLALTPGNPVLTQDPALIERWAFWRSANWHSLCTEQGAGLFYGLGIAVALGLLATRVKPHEDEPPVRGWTEGFSVSFILNALLFVNMIKMIEDWTRQQAGNFQAVPSHMRMPLFQSVNLSAWAWFAVFFLLFTILTVALLAVHARRPLAVVPPTSLGKGQFFYLLFLWAIVIGNFTKALPSFTEQRIGTEGLIMANAMLATFLILVFARDRDAVPFRPGADFSGMPRRTILAGVALFLLLTAGYTMAIRDLYGDKPLGWGGKNLRFGAEADWRVKPILKDKVHR